MPLHLLPRMSRLPNAWLLLSLIALVVLYPFLEPFSGGRAAIAVWDLVVLVLALRAARATGPETRIGYVLVLPAVVLHIAAAFLPLPALVMANFATQAMFHAFVVVCLLRYILRDEVMTLDELFAAAGLYFLMGFVFSHLFAMIEMQAPGSFLAGNDVDGRMGWFDLLYFSFTCLTNTGFGDVVAVSHHARSVVMLEQMMGVLYLALIISRLVALQSRRANRNP